MHGALPTVAADSRGETVAAWYFERPRSSTVVARVSRDGGRTWGPDQILGRATEEDGGAGAAIRASVGANGRIAVVWQHRHAGSVAATIAEAGADGRFGAAQVVSAPKVGANDPDVAVDAQGQAVVVWAALGRGFARAVLRPDGKLLSRRVIPGSGGANEPTVAVDPRGDRLYAWIASTRSCDACAFAARETSTGTLSRGQRLSTDSLADDADAVQAALSRRGRATVAWEETSGERQVAVIDASSAARHGRFGAPQQLSRPLSPNSNVILGGGGFGARGVGVDGSGRVSAVWVQYPVGGRGLSVVQVATSDASGRFHGARTLQREHGTHTYERPAVAVALGGRVIATWTILESGGGVSRFDGVWGAAGTHGFSAPARFSGPNGDQSAVTATSRSGAGLAIWSASASGIGRVAAARRAP